MALVHSPMRCIHRLCLAACFMAVAPWALSQTPGALPIPEDPNVRVLEQLANAPDGVDYAKVQAAIERAVNPAFDAVAFNAELDRLANLARARVAKGALPTEVMTALGEVIYTPGPWNDRKRLS